MRILNTDADKALKNVILYLKVEEAKELYDSIGMLLKEDVSKSHVHVNDSSFEHELTIVLYDEEKIELLNERALQIIL